MMTANGEMSRPIVEDETESPFPPIQDYRQSNETCDNSGGEVFDLFISPASRECH
jgi:hypothetical protein